MTAEPVGTGDRAPGGRSAGLDVALRDLADQLTAWTGLASAIGRIEPAGTIPTTLVLEVVRFVPQPYRIDVASARVDAEVMISGCGGDHARQADGVAAAMLHLLADGRWEVLSGRPDPQVSTTPARPGGPVFSIMVPVALPVPRRSAPPVRHPLQVRDLSIRDVSGRVLAADGTPLPGATVRQRPGGRESRTDPHGRWSLRLPNLDLTLEVSARGHHTSYRLPADPPAPAGLPRARSVIDIVLADLGAAASDTRPPST